MERKQERISRMCVASSVNANYFHGSSFLVGGFPRQYKLGLLGTWEHGIESKKSFPWTETE